MWMNSVNRNWVVRGWSPGKVNFLIKFVGGCLLAAVDLCFDIGGFSVVVVCRGVGVFVVFVIVIILTSLRKGDSMNFCFTRIL